jgi:cytochrome c-type biogenesis protein
LNKTAGREANVRDLGFFSSMLFGFIFAVGWTPCVGAFLGSALMLASREGSAARGMLMLLVFSLGLGIPFVVSAVLIGRLKTVFNFIKKHYKIVNMASGGLLVAVGIMMMTGLMGHFLSILGG